MYTRGSALLSTEINRIITDKNATLGSLFKPPFSKYVKELFANGEQGFFYDPNDLSTMFQDAAGTVPVTAVGQPVGLIRDKSGRNNHAFQANSASRPILRKNAVTGFNYLEFDGSDDFLQTNNIDFTGTDKMSLFAGAKSLLTSSSALVELGANPSLEQGTFWFNCNAISSKDVWIAMAQSSTYRTGFSKVVNNPNGFVFSAKLDFAGALAEDEIKPRVNGDSSGFARGLSTSAGSGNFGNHPLYIGRRGGTSIPFSGHIYSLIGVGKLVSDNETLAIEKEFAKRIGVTLNV